MERAIRTVHLASFLPRLHIEAAALALCLVGAIFIAMAFGASVPESFAVLLVPLLWAARRFGIVGALATMLAIAAPVAFLVAEGHQSVASLVRRENGAIVLVLVSAISVPVLMLAHAADELRRTAETIKREIAASRAARDRVTASLKAARGKAAPELASRLVVGEMHAAVTHQINQPLGAILNNAEAGIVLLQSGRPSLHDIESILIDVRADALRAGEISHRVRALMQFQELRRQIVDLNRSIESVIDLLGDQAALRGVVIELSLADHASVHADPVHLEQVLLNLIVNAMDAIMDVPPGHRTISIRTSITEHGSVEVGVSDTGTGIDPETLEHIFEPFRTTKTRGMGVGLSIVRFIIRAHGGEISAANNAPGPGATFRFELPGECDSGPSAASGSEADSEIAASSL